MIFGGYVVRLLVCVQARLGWEMAHTVLTGEFLQAGASTSLRCRHVVVCMYCPGLWKETSNPSRGFKLAILRGESLSHEFSFLAYIISILRPDWLMLSVQ